MTASSSETGYRFIKRMNDGLVGLSSSHGHQLFTTVKLRKAKSCALCRVPLKPGDVVYSPVTHGYNRMHRLCVACVHELERA